MAHYDGRVADDSITGPYYAEPLAFMFNRQAETACAIMAKREACDFVNVTYQPDEVWDSVSAHNGIYLTLVGKDVAAGEEWSTRVRLQLIWLRHNFGVVLERYNEFLEG